MFKTIIVDLAGLFVIASSIYDMYVNHKSDKFNEEMRKTNKDLENIINHQSTNILNKSELYKALKEALKRFGEEPVSDPDTKEYLGNIKIKS